MSFEREVNKEHVKIVKEYLKSENCGRAYTFTDFFVRNGYVKKESDLQHRGNNIFTHCPFHTDKTPSFSFSDEKKICKCFSCNFGGTFFDFLLKYENTVNGRSVSYYGLLNELLENDPIMQAELGFSTVFVMHNIYKGEISYKPFRPRNLKKEYLPQRYLELAKKIKKDGFPEEIIFKFILLMQMEVPPEDIYTELYHGRVSRIPAKVNGIPTKTEDNTIYDFTDFLKED